MVIMGATILCDHKNVSCTIAAILPKVLKQREV